MPMPVQLQGRDAALQCIITFVCHDFGQPLALCLVLLKQVPTASHWSEHTLHQICAKLGPAVHVTCWYLPSGLVCCRCQASGSPFAA